MPGYIGYTGNNSALVQTSVGYMMYVDTQNPGITPHLYNTGRWEPRLTRHYTKKNSLAGKVCLDVGANMGYYCSLFGHMKAKEVHVFEPLKDLLRLCRMSSAFNGARSGVDFHFYENVVGNKIRTAGFTIAEERGGSAVDNKGPHTVNMITIDSLNFPVVDIMKLDIEGYEPQALIGATETIARSPDIEIYAEYHPSADQAEKLQEAVDSLDLKVSKLEGTSVVKVENLNNLTTFSDLILTK